MHKSRIEPQTCYELFGIECGEGWKKLYQPIIDKIDEHNNKFPDNKITITQIKEKFAGLRFYADNTTEEIDNMISDAEDKSYKVCEICGEEHNVGILNCNGWYSTLCMDCTKKNIMKRERKPTHIIFKINNKLYTFNENNEFKLKEDGK